MFLSSLYNEAIEAPYRPALLVGKEQVWRQFPFAALRDETERWAAIFAGLQLGSGSLVLLVFDHREEAYFCFLGAMRAGLVPSFLPYPTPKQDPAAHWSSHAQLFERLGAGCIVSFGPHVDRIRRLVNVLRWHVYDVADLSLRRKRGSLPRLSDIERPERPALLQHSSGTTGLKKGVALTYGQIRAQADAYRAAIGGNRHDRTVSWLPLYHDMGLMTGFLLPLSTGSMVVTIDAFEWLARPPMLLDLIETYAATLCWMPNFAFQHLARLEDQAVSRDLSSMRAFVSCSEPCKPATFERFAEAFAPAGVTAGMLQTCYAMAETVFAVSQSRIGAPVRVLGVNPQALGRGEVVVADADDPLAQRLLSCGAPIAGVGLRVATGGRDGEPARIGEIQVQAPFLFAGYHANADATAGAFDGPWYRTGDMGFLHDGEVYVCGRSKEMLIVHGRNFYANDIEEIVGAVPGVKPGRVLAFGEFDPDTASEEAVILAETLLDRDETARADLKRRIRDAVFDRLDLTVHMVDLRDVGTLSKTTSGKIRREAQPPVETTETARPSRDSAEADTPDHRTGPEPAAQGYNLGSNLPEIVMAVIADTFNAPAGAITRRSVASDVDGWDSLGHSILLLRLSRRLEVEVGEQVAHGAKTVGDLIDRLAGLRA